MTRYDTRKAEGQNRESSLKWLIFVSKLSMNVRFHSSTCSCCKRNFIFTVVFPIFRSNISFFRVFFFSMLLIVCETNERDSLTRILLILIGSKKNVSTLKQIFLSLKTWKTNFDFAIKWMTFYLSNIFLLSFVIWMHRINQGYSLHQYSKTFLSEHLYTMDNSV